MRLVLDATAGNRHMWGGDKNDPRVVFMDKEKNLRVSPDVIAKWDNIPYPDNFFWCVIFDPPHVFSLTSMYNKDPKAKPNGSKKIPGWYGAFKSKRHAVVEIYNAQKEFARVSGNLLFKWNESSLSIDRVLSCFSFWDVLRIAPQYSRGNKPRTFWVKLVRKTGVV